MTLQTIIVTDRDFWGLSALVRAQAHGSARDRAHIEKLEEELARSVPVPSAKVPSNVVTMHSQVQVRDSTSGAARVYTLVFPHEADVGLGRLSVLAPLGTALLGYRAGDEIEWEMPGGVRRVRIESVRQSPVARGRVPSPEVAAVKARRRASRRRPSLAPVDGAA